MGLIFLGRGLFIGGLAAIVLSAAPALLVALLPGLGEKFLGTLAALLVLTVTPLAAVVASVGVLLLLIGWLQRRGRG